MLSFGYGNGYGLDYSNSSGDINGYGDEKCIMKFPLQYAKILSQKYLNIDDDIIPEIEMCLEREGDKVSVPYEVEVFGTTINSDSYGDGNGNGDGYGYGYGNGYGYCNGYGYGNGNGNGY